MSRFDALIWDFDGTLFDTYPHIVSAFVRANADNGISVDYDTAFAKFKVSYGEAKACFGTSDAVWGDFRAYEQDVTFSPTAKPYDGILSLFAETEKRGIRHFLYTNRNHLAIAYLKSAGLYPYFTECITSGDEAYAPKPSVEPIVYLLRKYGLSKDRTVMLGDREIDVICGMDAGIHGILFDEYGKLGATAADFRVYSIAEMKTLCLS